MTYYNPFYEKLGNINPVLSNPTPCTNYPKTNDFEQPIFDNINQTKNLNFWYQTYDYHINDEFVYSGVCNTHLLDNCNTHTNKGICNPNSFNNNLTLHFKSNKLN